MPGGQNSSKRQTVFFLPIDPRDKEHKDPETIDLNVPRRAQYLHNAWKKHQDAVFWVDIDLAIRKGLTFYQTRSNAIILQGILPAYCMPKVVRLKTGEVLFEKAYMSPRPPPKISLRHDWTKELGSKVDRQPEGEIDRQPGEEVAQQAKFFQPAQPIPNPIRDRSGRPGITQDVIDVQDERKTSRSQKISVNSFTEELCSSDRSGRLGITQNVVSVQTRSSEDSKSLNVEQTHDKTGRLVKDTVPVQDDPEVYHEAETLNIDNETIRERIKADMDFKIPRLPHSIVKHAQSASVRELIQKIENHHNRHALQQDLRQNQSFSPFSPESKQMIYEVGNIELCELLETEPKEQCKVCLSYWDTGIVYCTCGHLLRKGRGANHQFIKYTMDLFSIPDYVIKKGRPHGHRYGKKPGEQGILFGQPVEEEVQEKVLPGCP